MPIQPRRSHPSVSPAAGKPALAQGGAPAPPFCWQPAGCSDPQASAGSSRQPQKPPAARATSGSGTPRP
eukprot:2857121-Alexandrium_andersonii.AAC.1